MSARTEETNNTTTERRGRTRQVIDNLTKEREQLLVMFCRVAGLEPYGGNSSVETLIREFSQILVDYVAAVHFEVYARLAEGTERRREVIRVAEQQYPTIAAATQRAVDFNDKYEHSDEELPLDNLGRDLSELGEMMANRFELEDQLFQALLHPR